MKELEMIDVEAAVAEYMNSAEPTALDSRFRQLSDTYIESELFELLATLVGLSLRGAWLAGAKWALLLTEEEGK